jgi:hypothetical protein
MIYARSRQAGAGAPQGRPSGRGAAVERFGAEGAEIAAVRARCAGLGDAERRFWQATSRFAASWDEYLQGLDTATRMLESDRYR